MESQDNAGQSSCLDGGGRLLLSSSGFGIEINVQICQQDCYSITTAGSEER